MAPVNTESCNFTPNKQGAHQALPIAFTKALQRHPVGSAIGAPPAYFSGFPQRHIFNPMDISLLLLVCTAWPPGACRITFFVVVFFKPIGRGGHFDLYCHSSCRPKMTSQWLRAPVTSVQVRAAADFGHRRRLGQGLFDVLYLARVMKELIDDVALTPRSGSFSSRGQQTDARAGILSTDGPCRQTLALGVTCEECVRAHGGATV